MTFGYLLTYVQSVFSDLIACGITKRLCINNRPLDNSTIDVAILLDSRILVDCRQYCYLEPIEVLVIACLLLVDFVKVCLHKHLSVTEADYTGIWTEHQLFLIVLPGT